MCSDSHHAICRAYGDHNLEVIFILLQKPRKSLKFSRSIISGMMVPNWQDFTKSCTGYNCFLTHWVPEVVQKIHSTQYPLACKPILTYVLEIENFRWLKWSRWNLDLNIIHINLEYPIRIIFCSESHRLLTLRYFFKFDVPNERF